MIVATLSEIVVESAFLQLPASYIDGESLSKLWTIMQRSNSINVDSVG
jgi:hypothetical protein